MVVPVLKKKDFKRMVVGTGLFFETFNIQPSYTERGKDRKKSEQFLHLQNRKRIRMQHSSFSGLDYLNTSWAFSK